MSTALQPEIRLTVEQELEEIKRANGGTATPYQVVEYAKNPDTALHSKFTWDDSEAARAYRLWQARQVLRVYVQYEIPERKTTQVKLKVAEAKPVAAKTIRGTVSLPSDRKAGNGYRWIEDVLEHPDRRAEMLTMAKRELELFRRKYKELSELADVHAAIDKVIES